ncbi:ATPase, T2SS/T4P/T4SS family [Alphaproteobacteria bacterium]|nr:ATPase, T2SS/T4P/T4SS family [Alphaproteobacteria bacterium]
MVELQGLLAVIRKRGLLDDKTSIDNLQLQDSDRPDLALIDSGFVEESDMFEVLAEYLDLPIANTEQFPNSPLKAGGANISFLRQKRMLPILEDDTSITFALSDPPDKMSLQSIKLLVNKDVNIQLAKAGDLDRAFDRLYDREKTKKPTVSKNHVKDEVSIENDSPAVKLFNQLVNTAISNEASDLHIESSFSGLKLRYRVDGKLLELGNSPPEYLKEMLISRIKVLANLNIAEKRLPQDGRITVNVSGRSIDVRVSTIPTINGESIVLRFLDSEKGPNDLTALGLSNHTLSTLRRLLKAPHGMILTTGPTGSGKTTTLYAALQELNLVERKIITLEDPIEYRVENINQIQINPKVGLNFASLLRSVLRQDPDIIMVGEIRDEETARLATQSALTGHLVLSSLHTNNAFGALNRLLDMGLEPFLINAAVKVIISQRLIRRLCPKCKKSGSVSPAEQKQFGLKIGMSISRPNGCMSCYQTGYKGRLVLTELLELNDNIRDHVNNSRKVSSMDCSLLPEQTLANAARAHIEAGETSIEEFVSIMGSLD